MERRELKFKRHHFDFNGDYIQSTEWGIFDYGFRSPSSLSNEDKDKFIDCQLTGLKDKNGDPIFEGDIVTSDFHGKSELKVVFNFGGFKLSFGHENSFLFAPSKNIIAGFEIIGNIHNPHKKP